MAKEGETDYCGDYICEECPRFINATCDTVKADSENFAPPRKAAEVLVQ